MWKIVALIWLAFNSVMPSIGQLGNLARGLIPLLQSASQNAVHINCFLIVTDGSYFHDNILQEIIPHLEIPILLKTHESFHRNWTASSHNAPGVGSATFTITCRFQIFLISDPNEAIEAINHTLLDPSLQKPIRLAFISFKPERDFCQKILASQPLQLFAHATCIRPFKKGGKIQWELRTHSPLHTPSRIRTLGTWNGTSLVSTPKTSFYPAKFLNLHGSKLKVCSFLYEPYVTQFNESHQLFRGAEISFIQLMGQIMNFTPVFYSPPDGYRWGVPVDNDTWTGLFGELQKGTTDLAVASLYYARGYLPFVDMAYPHYPDCFTILIVKPGQKPRYSALGQPFEFDLWVATLIFFIISGLLPPVLAEIYHRSLPEKNPGMFFRKPGFAVFYNVQAITGTMSIDDRSPWPVRVSVSFVWVIFSVLISGYRAYLTSCLSFPGTFPPVDTVDQFLKRWRNWSFVYVSNLFLQSYNVLSGMEWSGFIEAKRLMVQSEDSTNRRIGEGFLVLNRSASVGVTVTPSVAYVDSRNYVEYLALTTNLNRHGSPTLQTIKECLQSFNVAVAMVKHSPLKETFSNVILRLLQSGLVQESFKEATNQGRIFAQRNASSVEEERNSLVLSLDDLQGAFYLYSLCLAPSIIAFLFECCVSHHKSRHS